MATKPRKPPIFRVYVGGYIRTARHNWHDPDKPEYWSGDMLLAETRNRRAARRLFRMVKLDVMTLRYKANRVWLQRYQTTIARREA